ncbi:MAG: 16S rRNA (cytosine(1402)-N(4))-methyltransferase RsmH [Bdellovibrionota bacterium]
MTTTFNHITVLKKETIDNLFPSESLLSCLKNKNEKELFFLDATLGGAGHALYLIDSFAQREELKNYQLNLIAIDRDLEAIQYAENLLNAKKNEFQNFNFKIFHDNFMNSQDLLSAHFPGQKFHGVYADLGVSSPQLDKSDRGFSFLQEGPVDMRMDCTQTLTAKDVLLTYSEKELVKIFFDYGEEPKSKKLAQCIVMDRSKGLLPVNNIKELAAYMKRVLAYPSNSRSHPATRAFQALRIEVNSELESIETLLNSIPQFVHDFGKAAFISFHSLEDRLVKRAMRNWQSGKMAKEKAEKQNDFNLPLHIQLCLYDNRKATFGKETPRGGIIPTEAEIANNSRSRSARLRCFEFHRTSENSNV